ncbi:MAG: iron-sulfur cluster assembly scaffold protein, partial [Acidobacteria bacterium]|nr:iron-sulfur cluster assembly scaffold protein [Acidobacteriota bacterium]
MSVLTDLNQDVILDHNRAPRNFGPLDHPDRTANGHNPLCGDELRVYVALDGNT